MSGTLTITYVNSGWSQQEVSRSQTGGSGQPDLTVFVTQWTLSGHPPLTREMYASERDDAVAGDATTTEIHGFQGDDTLSSPGGYLGGDMGDDLLQGGDGDNVLAGGLGDDTIEGGAGFDVVAYGNMVAYDDTPHGLTVDLRIAGPQQTGEGLDVLANIEGVSGSPYADSLTGDAGANRLIGAAGDDIVYGLGGSDTINGGDPNEEGPDTGSSDQLRGGDGDDLIIGSAGFDDIGGGAGADTISGVFYWDVDRGNHLRGDDGNDSITGGAAFDDINGNAGNDTVSGGDGDDWVAGGKDDDVLHGDGGADLVLGNLGNDSAGGDAGNDTVRGGQGDDSLAGGAGDDWLSGDLGADTLSGGAGADVFHSFGDAGVDRVTDFSRGEGDRVMLDAGAAYTVAQVGADTVITLGGGAQMVLVGVQLSTLSGDWIFTG